MSGPLALVLIFVGGIFTWATPRFRGSTTAAASLSKGGVLVIGVFLTVVGIVLLMLEAGFSAE
jgi:hypothetical protein